MRSIVLLLGLAATVASAGQSAVTDDPTEAAPPSEPRAAEPPSEPEWDTPSSFTEAPSTGAPEPAREPAPPPPPLPTSEAPSSRPAFTGSAPPTRPAFTGPATPARERAQRYSTLSAGEGGSTLVLTQVIAGTVNGAMLGEAFSSVGTNAADHAYSGAVLGALTLGAATTLYQYWVPVRRNEALLASGASTLGFTAAVTAANAWGMDSRGRALLSLTGSQGGLLAVLALTSGGDDVSDGDVGLIGSTSLYAVIFTSLAEYIRAEETGQDYRFTPLLLAPAVGMALGGLLSVPLELRPSSIRELTTYPLGAGLVALLVGAKFASNGATVAKTVLGTVGGTFGLIALLTVLSDTQPTPSEARASEDAQAVPVPVMIPAGRRNEALAAGAGLFVRF